MSNENNDISSNAIIDSSGNQQLEERKKKYIQMRLEQHKKMKESLIEIVCRQTDYTYELAKEKLEKSNYNHLLVLNEYFGIDNKEKNETKKSNNTINQQIYGEIRNLMDTGARKFRLEQEKAKYIEEMQNKIKNQQEKIKDKQD